jgi:Flp pilus assembly protein TadG
MKRIRSVAGREEGFALVYMAATLATLMLFSGLAVDSGRAYMVKAQLTKAVDGAALAAARNLNLGDPRAEAVRIFKANFPPGYLGTSSDIDPTTQAEFFSSSVDVASGVNTVEVTASAVLPTTFMRLANFNDVRVSSVGAATRRMVDLSLVLDTSSSIGQTTGWPAVRDAARAFVNAFDAANDRFSLVFYDNGAQVIDAMPSARGFNKSKVKSDIPTSLPGGSTNMVEGLYRGWDEIRSVPKGQQSGLRVIVLFTDGASNGVPGDYGAVPGNTQAAAGIATSLRTADFPKNLPDPDGQTHNNPAIAGLYDTATDAQRRPTGAQTSINAPTWDNKDTRLAGILWMPTTSWHPHRRSAGIPTSFPLQSSTLMVNGLPQSSRRGLRNFNVAQGRYPAEVWNINNAARNLVEIIANEARNDDDGDYPIRIYTIGMGELVRYNLGTMPEKPEDILKRIANDKSSPDFNDDQVEGKYYYARTPADVGPAFQELQSQILRLSK